MVSMCLMSILALALTFAQLISATCNSFDVYGTYTGFSGLPHGITHRISTGYHCPDRSDLLRCLATGVAIRFELLRWYMQTNLTEETYAALYPVVGNWTSGPWTQRLVGRSSGATLSIPLGGINQRTAGYIAFTPFYDCRVGIVRDCSEGFEVTDGTEIGLCEPNVVREYEGTREFLGNTDWVETEVEEAEQIMDQTPVDYVQPTGNGSTTNPDPVETEEGLGVKPAGSPTVWLLAAMGMLSLAFLL